MYTMMMALFALAINDFNCEAKIFSRCDLVRELRRQEFPFHGLQDWVCLIEAESKRNTAKVGRVGVTGPRTWGLFQLHERWCSIDKSTDYGCNVKCLDLISDNITKAANCAKFIYKNHNFDAWYGWYSKCKGKKLPDISGCY